MFKFGVLCLAVIAVGAFHIDDERIVGGQEAERGQFPYIVSLRRNTGRLHFCGGSIINNRFVVSAAHCMTGFQPNNVQIAVGANRNTGDGILHTINTVVIHPGYHRPTFSNDICILQVRVPIEFNQFVHPINLPRVDMPDNNLPLTVSGWGQFRVSISNATHEHNSCLM